MKAGMLAASMKISAQWPFVDYYIYRNKGQSELQLYAYVYDTVKICFNKYASNRS